MPVVNQKDAGQDPACRYEQTQTDWSEHYPQIRDVTKLAQSAAQTDSAGAAGGFFFFFLSSSVIVFNSPAAASIRSPFTASVVLQ